MEADQEGFLYPVVNNIQCVDCGLCKKVCSFTSYSTKTGNFSEPQVFAAKHISVTVRHCSSSGGMFTALSDEILQLNGVVYGAKFEDNLGVVHCRVETNSQRDSIRGSKYVQSDLKKTFATVRGDLRGNRMVLFTGTPCQNAGLTAYLSNVDTTNLVLCDLICHGVASPAVWMLFINYLQEKYDQKIVRYHFRHKTVSSDGTSLCAFLEDGSMVDSSDLEIFNIIYFGMWATRPSCHHCTFTKMNRPSDITIADFWGIEKYRPDFNDGKGVSLVFVNSKKGSILFSKIREKLIVIECDKNECMQPNLMAPAKPASQRDSFMKDFTRYPFKNVLQKYRIIDTGFIRLKKALKLGFKKIVTARKP
jgi:coenzyme F420-reducing hydrogenase beta subunit